jgi:hypothetical protein
VIDVRDTNGLGWHTRAWAVAAAAALATTPTTPVLMTAEQLARFPVDVVGPDVYFAGSTIPLVTSPAATPAPRVLPAPPVAPLSTEERVAALEARVVVLEARPGGGPNSAPAVVR